MKELVVISGKGGTGKTSITASLSVLARRPVIADCDVDAADLHLVLTPTVLERHDFRSGREAVIRREDCSGCGICITMCPYGARELDDVRKVVKVNEILCEGCGACAAACPSGAAQQRNQTDDQIFSMVKAILKG